MTQVPEAITARLQEIEDRLAEARQKQNDTAAAMARLAHDEAQLAEGIAARRREMRDLKIQRKTLRYAVDAIEGRVIHIGSVEAPIESVAVERVVVRQRHPKEDRRPRRGEPRPTPAKDAVYQTIRRLGRPATPTEITAEAGLPLRAVAAMLGVLGKQGMARRTEEGLWGPTHQ